MTPVASPTTAELDIAALRSTASSDNPAGPLFQSEYAESELTSNDPFINCSLSTGSHTINCCA